MGRLQPPKNLDVKGLLKNTADVISNTLTIDRRQAGGQHGEIQENIRKSSGFLKGAAVGAAAGATALVTGTSTAGSSGPGAGHPERASGQATGAPAPTPEQLARDAGNARPPATVRAVNRPGIGSDGSGAEGSRR